MTLCMHVATKDALIVCSDGKAALSIKKSDGSTEYDSDFSFDEIKSIIYNDVVISFAGTSILFENKIRHFIDFFDTLYDVSPESFNIRDLPGYLINILWGSGRYEFVDGGCDFLISGLSTEGEPQIYLVRPEFGEILHVPQFRNFACIGINGLADTISSDLLIPELSTKSVLKILNFVAKTYCNYGKLNFDELSDSKYFENYRHVTAVGGKWIFYVFYFKENKRNYIKFCADRDIRHYSKFVRNEFK